MIKRVNTKGFTLLEILLVVAAIGILASIVIFAINPGKQLADARNAQRKVDVNTILNAVHQYMIDHEGAIPSEIVFGDGLVNICRTGQNCGSINLSVLTDNEKYLTTIPFDPASNDEAATDYFIGRTSTGRITVSAPNAELEVVISVTR
jgi:prepilin-type N-terminal cleavage/methylation domain-containing protein